MAFWWKPYERLLETKPVSGVEAVKDLVAKELVEMWAAFPPAESEVAWEDPALEKKLRGRLHELPRLDARMVELVARLVALDLAHEIEAVDHLFRNNAHREAAPTPVHVEALHLVWRATLELLEARKEDARGLLKRADLGDVLERARARWLLRT